MPRLGTIYLYLLLFACLAVTAKADGWDDFANNLATDLAPLVALFGEQATKQYLSESTTTLDSFIFAMAPLGILTAVVSAIRVCRGPSLRAFIGRAKEGGGVAEAELCSSTSRDVCELYHNGAIVRVFGRPKILEVVHDRTADIPNVGDSKTTPKCGIYSFQEYIKTTPAETAVWKEVKTVGWKTSVKRAWDGIRARWRGKRIAEMMVGLDLLSWTAIMSRQRSHNSDGDDEFAPNPNLSFNIGIREQPDYIVWLAAIVGVLLQASVMVFAFLATYTFRWEKEDALPPAWAFPLMSAGTVFLAVGMFSCASLVDRSTQERVFRKDKAGSKGGSHKGGHERRSDEDNPDKKGPAIYVVQPGNQTVGDLTFDSFSFTDSAHPLRKYITSWKVNQEPGLWIWIATGITMSGFILQFVGLRAMHSTVSIFQLGVTLLMSVIRASLRTQRLEKDQNLLCQRPDEVEGHELDWLALQMTKDEPGKADAGRRFWSVVRSRKPYSLIRDNEPKPRIGSAQRALLYRARLAELSSQETPSKSRTSMAWGLPLVHARQQTQQLKKAIESTVDVLFTQADVNHQWRSASSITWVLNVSEYVEATDCFYLTPKETSEISLSLHRRKDSKHSVAWEVNQHSLEAMIGLWAWSITSDPHSERTEKFKLRVSTASETSASRIMAVGTDLEDLERIRTNLNLWFEEFPSSTPLSISEAALIASPRRPDALWHRLTDPINHDLRLEPYSSEYPCHWSQIMRLYGLHIPPYGERVTGAALITHVPESISTACAHDVYQSFFCAITEVLNSIGGKTTPVLKSRELHLTNDVVTRLVACFRESGLGSAQDAYSLVIPALAARSKIPLLGDVLPALHTHAESLRTEGKFHQAELILKTAFQTATDINTGSGADVSMLELGELYRYALFEKDGAQAEFGRSGISWMRQQMETLLPSTATIAARYSDLEKMASGEARVKPSAQDVLWAVSADERIDTLWLVSQVAEVLAVDKDGRTLLSLAAQRGWPEIVKSALAIGSAIDSGDHSRRTPISYAAGNGHADVVGILLENGADPIIQDDTGRTPLSYAATNGCVRTIETLLGDPRVTLLTSDHNGSLPLHWAASKGQDGAIKHLLKHQPEKTIDNHDGRYRTPLIIALLNHETQTAELLVTKGARRDLLFENNEPFWLAVENRVWAIALFLLKHTNRGISEMGRKKVAILRIVPRNFLDGRESDSSYVIRDTTLGDDVITCVYDAGGERMALTLETVQHVAAEEYIAVAELCERGIPDRTAGSLGYYSLSDGATALGFLLDLVEVQAEDLDGVAQAAAKNEQDGYTIMKLLFDRRGMEMEITEEVLRLAAGNRGMVGAELMGLLLGMPGADGKVTELVIREAAGNEWQGLAILELLFDAPGVDVLVTEAVVRAAARNTKDGVGVMKLLLDKRGAALEVTREVIEEASKNSESGIRVVQTLIEDESTTSKAKAAIDESSLSDTDIQRMLLPVPPREAVQGIKHGVEAIDLLLDKMDKRGAALKEVIKEASENSESGIRVVQTLIEDERTTSKAKAAI